MLIISLTIAQGFIVVVAVSLADDPAQKLPRFLVLFDLKWLVFVLERKWTNSCVEDALRLY